MPLPIADIISLAFESLYANKLRAGLTMLGMIIGVGAVVLLVSIGNGARNYITHEFEGIGTNLIIIQPGKTDTKTGFGPPLGSTKRRLTLSDVDALEKISNNLDSLSGLMFGAGAIKAENRTSNSTIIGCNENFNRIINVKIAQGRFISREEEEFGRRVVVLGYKVAKNLFDQENPLGKLVKINESEHRVIGVTQKSGETLGFRMDDLILIPTRAAMRILNDDKLFGIRAKAKSKVSLKDAVEEIRGILKIRHDNEEDFSIVTQDSMLDTMNTILNMLTYALAGIAMISMLVGGIGIMNIMLVSVTERTREIGIRRAVGARRTDVLKQFLFEALVLSLMGGLTGLLGSVFLTYVVYWVTSSFDMRAPLWIFPPAFLLSLLTGVVFGVWPARMAAKIETIEALRFE
jgi:putative ABC transport system permease protein